MYYKLKALKEEGYSVILHTYIYRRDRSEEKLAQVVDKVYYYERKTGIASQFSVKPYIVKSRSDRELLVNLQKDDHPILFEGLHTCFFLDHPNLKDRIRMVRAHNIEHEYYHYLEQSCISVWKRIFFKIESWRLRRFERILRNASRILAISTNECDYFRKNYPEADVEMLPCFFEQESSKDLPGKGNYILYHGNLAVEENENAALFILNQIAVALPEHHFVIAGAAPRQRLREAASGVPNVELIADLSKGEMDKLVSEARIHLLITFQNTGVKLKLLNALYKGAHCIVNPEMVSGAMLDPLCIVAEGPEKIIEAIMHYAGQPYTTELKEQRSLMLNQLYSCRKNISVITDGCTIEKK